MGFFTLLFAIILLALIAERIKGKTKTQNIKKSNIALLTIFTLFIVSLIGYGIQHTIQANDQVKEAASSKKASAISSSHKKMVNSKKAFIKYSGDDGYGLTANKDNVINTTLTLSQPAKISYTVDDLSEAKVISLTKSSDTTYKLSIQMLKQSKDDDGTDIYIHTNHDGYKVTKDISISNYASINDDSSDDSSSSSSSKPKESSSGKLSFNDAINELPDKLKGEVDDASWDKDEATVYITLDDNITDNFSDSDLKKLCYSLWTGVRRMAENANEQYASYITITDGQNNTISDTSTFGHFKYEGIGN